jgi:hypothetical protein
MGAKTNNARLAGEAGSQQQAAANQDFERRRLASQSFNTALADAEQRAARGQESSIPPNVGTSQENYRRMGGPFGRGRNIFNYRR